MLFTCRSATWCKYSRFSIRLTANSHLAARALSGLRFVLKPIDPCLKPIAVVETLTQQLFLKLLPCTMWERFLNLQVSRATAPNTALHSQYHSNTLVPDSLEMLLYLQWFPEVWCSCSHTSPLQLWHYSWGNWGMTELCDSVTSNCIQFLVEAEREVNSSWLFQMLLVWGFLLSHSLIQKP